MRRRLLGTLVIACLAMAAAPISLGAEHTDGFLTYHWGRCSQEREWAETAVPAECRRGGFVNGNGAFSLHSVVSTPQRGEAPATLGDFASNGAGFKVESAPPDGAYSVTATVVISNLDLIAFSRTQSISTPVGTEAGTSLTRVYTKATVSLMLSEVSAEGSRSYVAVEEIDVTKTGPISPTASAPAAKEGSRLEIWVTVWTYGGLSGNHRAEVDSVGFCRGWYGWLNGWCTPPLWFEPVSGRAESRISGEVENISVSST